MQALQISTSVRFASLLTEPHFLAQPGECHGSLSDVPVEFCLKGKDVSDCGTQVHKFLDCFQLIVSKAD